MLRIRLVEVDDFSPKVLSALKSRGEVVTGPCEVAELKKILEEFDVFWFRLKYQIDSAVLSSSTRCKFIVTPVTGIDHIDLDLCNSLGIQVICLKGESEFLRKVRATAELTIALTMDIMRKSTAAIVSVKAGAWDRDLFRGNELFEKKVGIVGMGRLGLITAGYFEALGCEVMGYDSDPQKQSTEWAMAKSLSDLLGWSDVVSLHVDLNESSINLIGLRELEMMKESAFLVNTSRGGVINEPDLQKALETNMIKGAALDVLQGEPGIDGNHPLIQFLNKGASNLIISPHIGGNTFESFSKTEEFIYDKLIKHLDI